MFNLEKAIGKWKKSLRKNPALEDGYIGELESHLRDLIDEHVDQGISLEGSFNYAVEQLGDTYELGNQFYKTYTTKYSGRPSWQTPVWMPSLLWNYIKIAIRNIKRHKSYSLINVFGFSVALVPAVLTLLYVAYEFSYDKHNENYDRIYRVAFQNGAIMPMPLAAALDADVPEIEYAVRMRTFSDFIAYKDKKILEPHILYADEDLFKVFTFRFISGNPKTALQDKYSIVFSESMAKKYFGDENPLGKTISLNKYTHLKVSGIYEDLPETSHFNADFVVSAKLIDPSSSLLASNSGYYSWGYSMFFTYVLLKENTNPTSFTGKIHGIMEKYSGEVMYKSYQYLAQPLGEIHLKSHFRTELKENADITEINIFLSMALIILVIAVINYVNLATARSTRRVKEIGVRKVIGAKKTQLIRQLIAETVVITFFSFVLTLALVNILLPYFNVFISRHIHFNLYDSIGVVSAILGIVLLVALVSGIYPALVLSSMKSLSFFSGTQASSRTPKLRSSLVILQFAITIILVFVTTVVNKQMDYIANKDLGYETEDIVNIRLSSRVSIEDGQILKNDVIQHPNIIAASSSSNTPNWFTGGTGLNWPGKPDNVSIPLNYTFVDCSYLDLFGIELIEGRKFNPEFTTDFTDAVIVNSAAVRAAAWDNPIGKKIKHVTPNGSEYREIIGVYNDVHIRSLHSNITPCYFVIDTTSNFYRVLSVRIKKENLSETIDFLKSKVKEFQPDYDFTYAFFDDQIKAMYKSDYKLQSVFTIFSIFTILISCLGLFGLVSFTTETRQKEIGIRKVLGASSFQIGAKILREMMILIVIASIIAAPLAYFGAEKWLEDFAYKTDIGFGVFILSGLLVYALSIGAMILQVRRASTRNPVDTLKYE